MSLCKDRGAVFGDEVAEDTSEDSAIVIFRNIGKRNACII